MFEKIFRKEWKDKLDLLIFALAGILLYVAAFLLFPERKELVDILTGAMTVIFLPFVGLLLGAGGFSSEFKDDAWAYLFSRPVKRSTVWLAKYCALLTILAAVLLVFAAAVRLVPEMNAAVADLSLKDLGGGTSLMSLGFLLSWVLLTISFSLSFLTDKQAAGGPAWSSRRSGTGRVISSSSTAIFQRSKPYPSRSTPTRPAGSSGSARPSSFAIGKKLSSGWQTLIPGLGGSSIEPDPFGKTPMRCVTRAI